MGCDGEIVSKIERDTRRETAEEIFKAIDEIFETRVHEICSVEHHPMKECPQCQYEELKKRFGVS